MTPTLEDSALTILPENCELFLDGLVEESRQWCLYAVIFKPENSCLNASFINESDELKNSATFGLWTMFWINSTVFLFFLIPREETLTIGICSVRDYFANKTYICMVILEYFRGSCFLGNIKDLSMRFLY